MSPLKTPHFELKRVNVDGAESAPVIVPITGLPSGTFMDRRGFLGAGLAATSVLALMGSSGCNALDGVTPGQEAGSPVAGGGEPLAQDLYIRVARDTPRTITLRGTGPDNGSEGLTYVILSEPRFGRLVEAPYNPPYVDYHLVYVPDAGYVGPDAFTYALYDGAWQSSPATVQITVVAPAAPPQPPEEPPPQPPEEPPPKPPEEPPPEPPPSGGGGGGGGGGGSICTCVPVCTCIPVCQAHMLMHSDSVVRVMADELLLVMGEKEFGYMAWAAQQAGPYLIARIYDAMDAIRAGAKPDPARWPCVSACAKRLDDSNQVVAIMAAQMLQQKEHVDGLKLTRPLRERVDQRLYEARRRAWFLRAGKNTITPVSARSFATI